MQPHADGAQPSPGGRLPPSYVRRSRLDGSRIALAVVVIVTTGAIAAASTPSWEESLFRAVNDLPRALDAPLWLLMQVGMSLAVPVAALILWLIVRDWRPPLGLIIGGIILGWGAAKLIKELVGRGRPDALFAGVQFGPDGPLEGIGFPSGHAVVGFTIAVVFSPYLPRWARWLLYVVAGIVAIARLHAGAHTPLDVIGGAAFGMIVGSTVNLAVGIRVDRARVGALPRWGPGTTGTGAPAG